MVINHICLQLFFTMPCCAMQRMLCTALPCCLMRHMLCHALPCCAVLHHAVLCCDSYAVYYCAVLRCAVNTRQSVFSMPLLFITNLCCLQSYPRASSEALVVWVTLLLSVTATSVTGEDDCYVSSAVQRSS